MYVVEFKENVTAVGRNGSLKQSGIAVVAKDDRLSIFPVTSKGTIGRCEIQIPADKVKNLIKVLQDIESRQGGYK